MSAQSLGNLRTIALLHVRAAEDAEILRADFPSLEFLVPDLGRWQDQVSTVEGVMLGRRVPVDALLEFAPRLRWIHSVGAGVERILTERFRNSDVLLTNSRGVHAVNVAEHALALMFSFARQLPALGRAQQDCHWTYPPQPQVFELQGQTLTIVGLGCIGRTLALKAQALGMRVLGVRRQAMAEEVPGVTRVFAFEELDEALDLAQHVVLCLPLTETTRGLLDADRLARIQPGAYLYNMGRGASLDSQALLDALNQGLLAGAGLDVTDPEPLPPDHPLWHHPQVLLTSHTSGRTPHEDLRTLEIFRENLRRVLAGENVLNLVDKNLGY